MTDLKELGSAAIWVAYTDAKAKIEKLEAENELLREIHLCSRGVMRYNGVDAKRCNDYFDKLKDATHVRLKS